MSTVTRTDIEHLIKLQDADVRILRAKKRLEELPERDSILKVREKLASVEKKAEQVAALRASCDQQLQKLQNDDEIQLKRGEELQQKIDETSDFRSITSLTRDLEGTVKRREKIDFEMSSELERSDKISVVEQQVQEAREALLAQESSLIQSFKDKGGALQREITEAQAESAQCAKSVTPELLARYKKVAQSKGGIALAHYNQGKCGACRCEYHEGQLAKIKAAGLLTECPSCHRILIVDEQNEA